MLPLAWTLNEQELFYSQDNLLFFYGGCEWFSESVDKADNIMQWGLLDIIKMAMTLIRFEKNDNNWKTIFKRIA